ncbi:MAG: 8-amino-7-oxononanoate synthase [Candidatus Gastranaerophilales bacterium]|nr:8-amino-7-oxononanoate synthase [Candidatus Gastranaerophilales bacterium]
MYDQNTKYQHFITDLDQLKSKDQFRSLVSISDKNNKYITIKDKKYLNLSSNDYLGLANDAELLEKFSEIVFKDKLINKLGMSSASSRLLTGNHELYEELEDELCKLYDREASIVFSSGYHANTGIISAITQKGDLILSDKLNHASIIDGMRLSRADFLRYNHLDYNHLKNLLESNLDKYKNILVISESIFSMDGDRTDLKKLVDLKNQYNTILMIDEAHAIGVFGEKGCGICEEDNLIQNIDIIVGTFGKALASVGAYAIINNILKEYLINKMRPFIFTTALPAFNLYWTLMIIKALPSFKFKREHLKDISDFLRNSIQDQGFVTGGESQIIPVIIGENDKTVKTAEKLKDAGIWLLPIRPPSVPEGTSRLRISLSASLEKTDISTIPDIIKGETL